jgi:hypothetical protein
MLTPEENILLLEELIKAFGNQRFIIFIHETHSTVEIERIMGMISEVLISYNQKEDEDGNNDNGK